MKPKPSGTKAKCYPSDLTRTQWKRLKRMLPEAKPGGRPRSVDLREVLNGIFYIVRGGCAWRMMPSDLPPWSTRYDHFREWRNDGTWAKLNDDLRTQVRHHHKRQESENVEKSRDSRRRSIRRGRRRRESKKQENLIHKL